MVYEDFGEDCFQIGKMAFEGGGGEAHGLGEHAQGKGMRVEADHQVLRRGKDVIPHIQLARRKFGPAGGQVFGIGAQDADGDWHEGGRLGFLSRSGQIFLRGRNGGWV